MCQAERKTSGTEAASGQESRAGTQESRPGKATLRLVLPKGSTLRYRTTQHSVRVMAGRELGVNDLVQEYGLEVLGLEPDGSLALEVRMGATKGRPAPCCRRRRSATSSRVPGVPTRSPRRRACRTRT